MLLAEASREEFHGVLAGLGKAASPPPPPFAGSGRRADGTELPVEITCSLVPAPAGAADAGTSVALSIRGAAGGNSGRTRTTPRRRPPQAGSVGRNLAAYFVRRRSSCFLEVQRLPLPRRSPSTTTNSRPARSATR